MRILITGDRSWWCRGLAADYLTVWRKASPQLVIVNGGAGGVDAAFHRECLRLGITEEMHPADWTKYGKAAGPIRNQAMVDSGVDACYAFHERLARSLGTLDCLNRALKAGIKCWHVYNTMGNIEQVKREIKVC